MKPASVSPTLTLLAVLSLGLMLSHASVALAQGEVRVGTGNSTLRNRRSAPGRRRGGRR